MENDIPVMHNTVGDNVKLKTADGQEIKIETKNIYQPWKKYGLF